MEDTKNQSADTSADAKKVETPTAPATEEKK
jgi:hypothetical protein